MIEPLIKQLLEAGVHFGHQTRRWNPKMKRFIFGEKSGIYIVDLKQTAEQLVKAQEFLRLVASQGGPILFVGTKRQAQPIIEEEATRCKQFYVNLRWLGGLLTNFQTIRKSVERLKTLRGWREDGTLLRLTKKEAAHREKELARLEKVLAGIIEMDRLPKALVAVDVKREETAVREANRLGIPVAGLVDTNSDPDPVAYVIPGNDDAIRSIKLVISLLADSVLEGYKACLAGQAPAAEAVAVPPAEAQATLPTILPSSDVTPAAATASAAAEGATTSAAPSPPAIAPPAVEEVEAIVPEAQLKAVEEAAPPKKKRAARTKVIPKATEKEAAP